MSELLLSTFRKSFITRRLGGIIALSFLISISSCSITQKNIAAGQPYTNQIDWPEAYTPEESTFFVHNAIAIDASPQKVWQILIDAKNWERDYEGASNFSFQSPTDTVLQPGSIFNWNTMGLSFQSEIKAYQPYEFLAWESKKQSIQGYHVWKIIPQGQGCKLVTQEAQTGWLAVMEKTFQKRKLERLHDQWLAVIKAQAENQPIP